MLCMCLLLVQVFKKETKGNGVSCLAFMFNEHCVEPTKININAQAYRINYMVYVLFSMCRLL